MLVRSEIQLKVLQHLTWATRGHIRSSTRGYVARAVANVGHLRKAPPHATERLLQLAPAIGDSESLQRSSDHAERIQTAQRRREVGGRQPTKWHGGTSRTAQGSHLEVVHRRRATRVPAVRSAADTKAVETPQSEPLCEIRVDERLASLSPIALAAARHATKRGAKDGPLL